MQNVIEHFSSFLGGTKGTISRSQIILKFSPNYFWYSQRICYIRLSVTCPEILPASSSYMALLRLGAVHTFLSSVVSTRHVLSRLHGKTQLFSPTGFSLFISHVLLTVLLPSWRVFKSSECKLPRILKIADLM